MAPRQEAEEFVSTVKGLFSRKDDLIYALDSNVTKSNIISPSTIGDLNVWVEVTLFNVGNPETILTPNGWAYLGEIGADIDIQQGGHYNGYNPTIEIHKTIDGY